MKEKNSMFYQYLTALVVDIAAFLHGLACGWPSSNVVLLLSDEPPLPSGKINIDEASWVVGLFCIGGLIGNLVFGYITNNYGRKEPLLATAIPCILSWSLTLFGQNVYYLYVARMLVGVFGGAVFVIAPRFLSEIASDSVRGVLGSSFLFSAHAGILTAFVFGNYCDYDMTPKVAIALSIAFVIAFFFFPESPSVLMKENRIAEAEKSIRFYRNIGGKANECEVLQFEMNKLKIAFGKTNSTKADEQNRLSLSDFIVKEARKGIIIGIALVALNQFCGCFAMINYTAKIFSEAGSSMSPNMSAIVVGAIQLLGSCSSTVLVDRAGRKFLMAASAFGTALGLICLGAFLMLKTQGYEVDSFNWIPICSFSFTIFIAALGVMTLPFLIISEILPEKIKNFGSSFCMSLLWIFAFTMLKFLPLLSQTFGLHGTMFLFAACSLSGGLFIILVMPETKGKNHEEIMQSLR